jgi:hypothetical protein
MHRALLTALIAGLTLPLIACQAASPAAAPAQVPAALPTDGPGLGRALDAAIGDAACRSDADCQTVAVGAKACGGPSGYRAYSLLGGQQARILALAEAQRAASRRAVAGSGMASDCMMVTDPGAACLAGRCTPRTDGRSRAVF